MELNQDELEMFHFFCFRLLHDFKKGKFGIPNFKFVFTKQDSNIILDYLRKLKDKGRAVQIGIKIPIIDRNVMICEIDSTIDLIKKTENEYNEVCNDDNIYIEVPNYKIFFQKLNELMIIYEEHHSLNNFDASSLLRSIWLRMGPSDMVNVIDFLNRQIGFIKQDYLMSSNQIEFMQMGDIYISYFNHGNNDFFETNRHIRPLLKIKIGEMESFNHGEKINLYNNYFLPVIHYGFIKENDETTCYVYGIQHLHNEQHDPVIKNIISNERRRLKNKHVSPDFIIALKVFVDILKTKGITKIKVPLLQVYNHEYHQNIGQYYCEKLKKYSPERINSFEWLDAPEYVIAEYEEIKKQVDRFWGKEDIISANKTERLVYTFYLFKEKYDDIEIITEPFVESDFLICKIKYTKENKHNL